MKKNYLLIALLAIGLGFASCSSDDDTTPTDESTEIAFENLPADSKQFINDHFAGYTVVGSNQKQTGYNAILSKSAGTNKSTSTVWQGDYKVEFNQQGEWIEIEGYNNSVVLPANVLALIPRSIVSYVSQNYPTRGITQIEKETYGYQIDLTGNLDIELMFDINGEFLAQDNDNDNDDQRIDLSQLPQAAQQFLSTHFSGRTPTLVKRDDNSYEVDYGNDTDLDFDLTGNWTKIDVDNNDVIPQSIMALLPQPILDYISTNHSTRKIESIENGVSTFEIDLSGDIDLEFDKAGNLWGSSANNNNNNNNGQRIEFSSLAQPIQATLNSYFLGNTVTFLYAERDDNEIEVKLSNGTDLDFYTDGSLKSVEVLPGNSVPDSVIPASILSYVRANYADKVIEEYESRTYGYKVELSGYPELELIFDVNGNFSGLDD